jgi:hypothetical protein
MDETAHGVPLAGLLRQVARDVVATQRQLDESFVSTRSARADRGEGLNPVWYRLEHVTIALELHASVGDAEGPAGAGASPQLVCRLPNPVAVALYGRDAMTSTRVSVEIAPIMPRF